VLTYLARVELHTNIDSWSGSNNNDVDQC